MKIFARSTLALVVLTTLGACVQYVPVAHASGREDWRDAQTGVVNDQHIGVAYGVVSAIEPAQQSNGSGAAGALLGGVALSAANPASQCDSTAAAS